MIPALLLACGSALLGGALALASRARRGLLERTRTFAFAAAASVVGFHLLPEVLPELGLRALLWMAGGFALPGVLEVAARALSRGQPQHGPTGLRVAAEVGFAALVFHSLIEGLTLWAALQSPGGHVDLEIAIVAHHAPLTAAVALPFLDVIGPRGTAVRVLGVALAGALGVLAGAALPGVSAMPIEAMLMPAIAAAAGALLHVAFDEIGEQRFRSPVERTADLFACALGVGIAGASALRGAQHEPAQAQLLQSFLRALLGVALGAAPALLAGAIAVELLRRVRSDGGALARVVAALGVDAGLLTWQLFSAVALALRAGVALAFAFAVPSPPPLAAGPQSAGPLEDTARRAPWLLFGLALAAALEQLTSLGSLRPLPLATAAAGLVLLGTALPPRHAGSAAATMVAAVLVGKGAPVMLVFAALAVGSAVDASALRSHRGALALLVGAPLAMLATSLLRVTVALPLPGTSTADLAEQARAHPAQAAALAAWLALVLIALWWRGVRGFFAPLRHGNALRDRLTLDG